MSFWTVNFLLFIIFYLENLINLVKIPVQDILFVFTQIQFQNLSHRINHGKQRNKKYGHYLVYENGRLDRQWQQRLNAFYFSNNQSITFIFCIPL